MYTRSARRNACKQICLFRRTPIFTNVDPFCLICINFGQFVKGANHFRQLVKGVNKFSWVFFAFHHFSALLSNYPPISANFSQFSSTSANIYQFFPISANFHRFLPISANFHQFLPISANLNQFQSISDNSLKEKGNLIALPYIYSAIQNQGLHFALIRTSLPGTHIPVKHDTSKSASFIQQVQL